MSERIYEPKLRMTASVDGPLLGDEMYQVGFYDAGIMRKILNHIGSGDYKIYTLPIPRTPREFEIAKHFLYDPKVQYALVDKSQGGHKVVYCVIEDSPGWMSVLSKLGYEVYSGPKTNKRLKSFHRPALLNAHFDHLHVEVVDPTDYTRYNFYSVDDDMGVIPEYQTDAVRERLLDGGFVISTRIIQQAVKNIPMHLPPANDEVQTRDYYYDPVLRQHLIEDLLSTPVFNVRITGSEGFIKGNAIVAELPEGIDVITSEANIKSEIKCTTGYSFLAEPQGSKKRVLTDDQTFINFPQLFPHEDMEMWLDEDYQKIFNDATSGHLMTSWKHIYQRRWRDDHDLADNEARAKSQYIGYRWTAAGFNITQSPWLFKTSAISNAKPLEHRLPIPCAVYEQIISESLARMAGYDIEVEEGTIVRINELQVHVVSDIDWVEMYTSHGGHDQDDFFKLFYRNMEGGDYDGENVVIAVRSPNGYGEYTIFNYVEGSWSPTWHKADGTPIKFPKIDGTNWPTRLSTAVKFNQVNYLGLPSKSLPRQNRSGLYTQDDVIRDMEIAMSGGNVGGFVNAVMTHSMVLANHRPEQLCSLEDAIDKCINPDNVADVQAIDAETRKIMREVIDSGQDIDRSLWFGRKISMFVSPEEQPNLVEGRLTKFFKLCSAKNQAFKIRVDEWSQKNARPPQIVFDLGARLYTFAHPIVNDFRSNVQKANSTQYQNSNGLIARNEWESIYDYVVDTILSYERVEDRHDFVISLLSVALQQPTTLGTVSDQIVMNRHVYPYLESALQFYGVAMIPFFVVDNNSFKIERYKVDEFTYVTPEGEQLLFTDPLEYQNAHKKDSPLPISMAPATGVFDHLLVK